MYNVKIVSEEEGESDVYLCDRYTIRETSPDSTAARLELSPPGITIELGPPARKSFHIPTDGDVIFVENHDGKTIAKYPRDYKTKEQLAKEERENADLPLTNSAAEFRVTEK